MSATTGYDRAATTLAADIRTVLADEMAPRGWTVSRATTPSGKMLFGCDACGYLTLAPSLHWCPKVAVDCELNSFHARPAPALRQAAREHERRGGCSADIGKGARAQHQDEDSI